jgi:hypothetical protein
MALSTIACGDREHPSTSKMTISSVGTTRPGRLAAGFILFVTAAQFLYLAFGCEWDLCPDEAEYWAWSRKLDWNYYAKGPLIALVTRLGTVLAGEASLRLTGSLELAVRLPALILGALTAWGIYRLASETCRDARVGLIAVGLLPAVPLFRLGSLLMTSDTPLLCCWTWAAVWSHRAIVRDDLRCWLAAGFLAGLGVLAKLTMLAFPASVGLALILDSTRRRNLLRPGFWALAAGCGFALVPILAWNINNDWLAVEHLADRLGLTEHSTWGSVRILLGFLASEFVVLGIWWIFGILAIGRALVGLVGSTPEERSGPFYLISLWGVIWSACVTASLLGESEANWIAPAHVAVVVLIARWILEAIVRHRRGPVRFALVNWALAIGFLTLFQQTERLYPILARFCPEPAVNNPVPVIWIDPTCRMRGFRDLAGEVQERLRALRAEGQDPFVLTPSYGLASELSFYLPGQPEVYCLSWSPGFAVRANNQHDLWHPNPRHDLDAFRNRPAVVIADASPTPNNYAKGTVRQGLFAQAGPTSRMTVRRKGLVVASWELTICRDYQGIRDVESTRALLKTVLAPGFAAAEGGTLEGFVRGMYRTMLGRTPNAAEQEGWVKVLRQYPKEFVVSELLLSPECRNRCQLQGQAPAASEVAARRTSARLR